MGKKTIVLDIVKGKLVKQKKVKNICTNTGKECIYKCEGLCKERC